MPPRPQRGGPQGSGTNLQRHNQPLIFPFRIPETVSCYEEVHKKWLIMLKEAELLYKDDYTWQVRCSKGLGIPTRKMPPELLGRFYAQYCDLINKMYDAYLKSMQLQRSEYMIEIISILLKRMYELRQELVNVIVNDYIYVDAALQQLFMTPFDIQIVVPYHFARESREESVENLLQKMWRDSKIRKIKMERKLLKQATKPQKVEHSDPELAAMGGQKKEEEVEEEVEEEENYDEEVVSVPDQALINVLIIQSHERYRQFFLEKHAEKTAERLKYHVKITNPVPKKVKVKAAKLIQRVYRKFMEIKRKRWVDYKRDVALGLIPDPTYFPKYTQKQEAEKLYEKRLNKRHAIYKEHFMKEMERQQTKLLYVKKGEQIEDITGEIIEWFKEWYYNYGFFPQYPYPLEEGTMLVLRGDYPTIEEQFEFDEKWKKEFKNTTPDQRQKELEQKKMDAILKAEAAKERQRKEAEALFKQRCNPSTDPGYSMQTSAINDNIKQAFNRYRQAWSPFDTKGLTPEALYGYMKPFIVDTLLEKMYKESREYVDNLMRLEMKLFIKVQKAMWMSIGKLWPKMPVRKRPKKGPKIPIPLVVDDEMLVKFEKIFDLQIMSKPTTKLDDVMGDFSYTNYDKNILDPWAQFPSPSYGDVKRRLVYSCVFGSGVEKNFKRNKSVMLIGVPRNGKSFLVDAVAGELNAVKFDISPHVLSTRTNAPAKALPQIFLAARVFGPSVIFLKNIEKVFYKKVPAVEKREKAKNYKSPLTKLLKTIPPTDKVIFIATCSNPWAARIRPMMNLFSEKIYVPAPDYNSLQRFFYDKLQKQFSSPRDLCVQPIARLFRGIGFGIIIEMLERILCPDRIVKLYAQPLKFEEFMEYLIENGIEPLTDYEYEAWMKIYIQYSPLKKTREEYAVINFKRADGYEKLRKALEAKQNKK